MAFHKCLLITHTASHQNSLCLCCKQVISMRWKVMPGERRPRGVDILCWKLNPSPVESISHGKSQSSTLVWCHSCLKMHTQLPYSTVSWILSRKLWNICIQIRLLCWRWTSRSPPVSFSNNTQLCDNDWEWDRGGGGGGIFMLRWPGGWLNGSSGWQCNHNCWNSVAKSFVKVSYLSRTRHAHQVTDAALHILQQTAFLSYVEFEPDHAVSSEQWLHRWRLNNRLLFLTSSSVSFGVCIEFVVVTAIREMSRRFALDHVNYEMSNYPKLWKMQLLQSNLLCIALCVRRENCHRD